MIAHVTGCVSVIGPGFAVVEVGGIGLRLLMSSTSLAAMPARGDEVTLHTHLHVREDELTLFGFADVAEREAFEALLTVSGVGPKVALATLSALTPGDLGTAVATEDVALISSVPGVGRKTAQRIIVDLAGKLSGASGGSGAGEGGGGGGSAAETREALAAMGFTPQEVADALKGAPADGDAQGLLRHALSRLGSGTR